MAASEIEKLERLVRENPKGRQFAILADAYRKDGQFQRALDVLGPGLEVHPDYVSARVVLGRVLVAMGDNAKAKEAFTRVVELDPESVIALKALADLAEQEGEGTEALQRASQLLTVDPGNEEAQKQVERLSTSLKAPEEVRLSGIVPVDMDAVAAAEAPVAEVGGGAIPTPSDEERTAAPFEAVKPPVVKTVEIPAIPAPTSRPSFTAMPEPLERAPEPLPLMPLSEEAQVERTAEGVQPLAALEPTSFDAPSGTDVPTERLAGIDIGGVSAEEAAAISAAPGFEPTSGPLDTTDMPRTSLIGLESISGETEPETAPPAASDDIGLERETEIELGGADQNEYQESSAAETLRRRSGANEFQVASDADTLDAGAAAAHEAIETGGSDLAFITPDAEPEPEPEPMPPAAAAPQAPVFTPAALPPEEPEPAVAEPEPVVTEAMAELYASQGHLTAALEVYRQLAEREPAETRYAERIVELEMFAGGSALPEAPVSEAPRISAPVAAPAGSTAWDARSTGGKPVGSWLNEIFAEALPREAPALPEPQAPEPMMPEPVAFEEPEPVVEAGTPLPLIMPPEEEPAAPPEAVPPAAQGQPTRPASGGFSLNTVFGDERPGAPVKQGGSFDDFFGAPAAPAATPPPQPAGGTPAPRSTRPANPAPPAEDDLSSFQDWLKGLKK